jgi:hypothetical protein
MLDPNDFLIDVSATIATPYGRSALASLISNGDVVGAADNEAVSAGSTAAAAIADTSGEYAGVVNNYRWRTRSALGGDLLSEQYFVTVSTYSADGVPR